MLTSRQRAAYLAAGGAYGVGIFASLAGTAYWYRNYLGLGRLSDVPVSNDKRFQNMRRAFNSTATLICWSMAVMTVFDIADTPHKLSERRQLVAFGVATGTLFPIFIMSNTYLTWITYRSLTS